MAISGPKALEKATQILNATGKVWGVDPARLQSGWQGKRTNAARRTAAYIIKRDVETEKGVGCSYPWVARFLNNRHHTTIIHHCTVVTARLGYDVGLEHTIAAITALYPDMPKRKLIAVETPRPPIQTVLPVVAQIFGTSVARMQSEGRKDHCLIPRQAAMYLLRRDWHYTLNEISVHFPPKDHTNVLYSCKSIEQKMERDPELRLKVEMVRVRIAALMT